mmetsp:Transcript_41386/g.88205  ORF Transcript_41386/g.88205 Transcript_41386/m.88205 type:complete len:238 (+) Transcript_41386:69-782(+)
MAMPWMLRRSMFSKLANKYLCSSPSSSSSSAQLNLESQSLIILSLLALRNRPLSSTLARDVIPVLCPAKSRTNRTDGFPATFFSTFHILTIRSDLDPVRNDPSPRAAMEVTASFESALPPPPPLPLLPWVDAADDSCEEADAALPSDFWLRYMLVRDLRLFPTPLEFPPSEGLGEGPGGPSMPPCPDWTEETMPPIPTAPVAPPPAAAEAASSTSSFPLLVDRFTNCPLTKVSLSFG